MKKFIIILLSIILLFSVSSLSFAVEKKGQEEIKVAVPPELSVLPTASTVQQITGGVKAVNVSTKSILVTKKIRDKVIEALITVDNTTKIEKDKEQKTFTDLKVGDNVVVRYTKVDGKNIAKNISIQVGK